MLKEDIGRIMIIKENAIEDNNAFTDKLRQDVQNVWKIISEDLKLIKKQKIMDSRVKKLLIKT